eukprot:m.271472 g.271472  ORF g.271472 m.271472 type:complete len:56 (-) comp15683_c1_seq18:20-187(-)
MYAHEDEYKSRFLHLMQTLTHNICICTSIGSTPNVRFPHPAFHASNAPSLIVIHR